VSEDRRHALGRRGERVAAAYLHGRGCAVLARNVRTRRGEIDLIVRDGRSLVFVEVKTRRARSRHVPLREHEPLLCGLDRRQQARLRRLAAAWLHAQPPLPFAELVRFDAIGVLIDARDRVRQIEHVEAAW
jgi:putative endonuclease